MKKAFIIVAVLVGIGFLAKRAAGACSTVDWEQKFEAMPDNAPPKWMFRNITAIRENTERILEILGERSTGVVGGGEGGARR